jgi:hypothetical protein
LTRRIANKLQTQTPKAKEPRSMASDFFTKLGQDVCAALSNPGDRRQLARIQRTALAAHLNPPPGAMDQALSRTPRNGVRGIDQDPNGGDPNGITPQEALMFVDRLLAAFAADPDSSKLDQFVAGLVSLTQQDANALDRSRSGNRRSVADRRPGGAMDSAITTLNHSSFKRRFPDAASIRFGGTGR